MNSTIELLSFLGTPFASTSEEERGPIPEDVMAAYTLAKNNKVGLFYLDELRKVGHLSGLEEAYHDDVNRFKETCITAVRLCSALAEQTEEFALFKFMKPFPHTPSDVDVLFFLEHNEFLEIARILTEDNYAKIAESPSQTVIYDMRGGAATMDTRSVGGKRGGRYYIDLYSDVSASHVVYISNETIRGHRMRVDTEFGLVTTLDPIADLCVVLSHSIIPERLLTLSDYYTALHYLRHMNDSAISELVELFVRNNMTLACWHSAKFIADIHMRVQGFVPRGLSTLIEKLDVDSNRRREGLKGEITLPLRYGRTVLFDVLKERLKNEKGFRSMVNQVVESTNPRLASWVLSNWMLRRDRETY